MIRMKRSRIITAVAVAAILLMGTVLSGCGGLFGGLDCALDKVTSISFADDTVVMKVGDSIEITSDMIEVEPRFAADKDYYIESMDATVAAVTGTRTVTAYSFGATVLRVVSAADESVYGECTLKVDYADPSISIETDLAAGIVTGNGTIVMSAAGEYTAGFECVISEGSDPSLETEWTVNGKAMQPDSATSFEYIIPEGAGEYLVRVELPGYGLYAEQLILRFAGEVSVSALCEGETEQSESDGYEPVRFTAEATAGENDPRPVADWYVNDEFVCCGETFEFLPELSGAYSVRLKVNGVQTDILCGGESKSSVSLRFKGMVTPSNVSLEYDNCYPSVYVVWGEPAAGEYCVEINGTEYRSDGEYATRFDGTRFDATGIIDVFSGGSYRVRSLGDGDLYLESDYGKLQTYEALPAEAADYLRAQYYDGARNYYITSDEEFYETYAYMVLFRPDGKNASGGGVTVEKKLYIAYDTEHSTVDSLINTAFYRARFTGEYTNYFSGGSPVSRGVHTLKVTCYSSNVPTMYNNGDVYEGLNALRPHVNWSDEKAADEFPVDSCYPVTVSTGEELYYVAEQGYRPVPVSGSAAEELYDSARYVLTQIIAPDLMPLDPSVYAAEKAHAVYDWIMWRVSYDYDVTGVTEISEAVKYTAYYLEGVLGDGNALAVCDGMSKTYSLMCNILGIPCVRIAGRAGSDGQWGGHAWNKVKLPEGWYNVDCTWGDGLVSFEERVQNGFPFGGSTTVVLTKEKAAHDYLFLTDAEISVDHREDAPNDYPASAVATYNWYNEKTPYSGGETDFYMMTYSSFERELKDVIDYLIDTMPQSGRYTLTGTEVDSDYYGVDIRIADSIKSMVGAEKIYSVAREYLRNYGDYASRFRYIQIDSDGNYGIVMFTI